MSGAGINLFPVNLVEALKNRKVQIGIAVVAILLAVALTLIWVLQPKNDNPSQVGSAPAASTNAADGTAVTSSPASSAAPAASPGACSATDDAGFVPTSYSIEKLGVEANVLSMPRESDGSAPAPPPSESQAAAWWNEGPAAGSNAGQVVLAIHTYQNGEAVGNQLYKDGTSQLQAGDVLKLTGSDGRTACYQFTEDQKIAEADFDPTSDILERRTGDPALAIVICWDHNKETNGWDSRIFFKFTPVTA